MVLVMKLTETANDLPDLHESRRVHAPAIFRQADCTLTGGEVPVCAVPVLSNFPSVGRVFWLSLCT